MAEEFKDPRDLAWHPRRTNFLLGHREAESRLLQAHQSGKLHHAWLMTGPRGIGKATLAYRFARFLLQVPTPERARAHGSLHVAPDEPVARQVAAAAHPDLFVLERAIDTRAKRLKSEIAVDDARAAQGLFARTAATGGWRVCIVDSADDLNPESANALLKVIEEPPRQSVFLVVCHQPGRLLPTIRSRCLALPLSTLDNGATLQVLERLPPAALQADDAARRRAAALSKGRPGRALELARSRGAAVFEGFAARPKLTPAAAIETGAEFSGRDSPDDFTIFCELLVGWLAEKARDAGIGGKGDALAQAHDDIATSLRQSDALNLDRRQTVTDALLRIEEALKAS